MPLKKAFHQPNTIPHTTDGQCNGSLINANTQQNTNDEVTDGLRQYDDNIAAIDEPLDVGASHCWLLRAPLLEIKATSYDTA